MNVLFLTRLYHPHVGGVEKHLMEITNRLVKKGYNFSIIAQKYDPSLSSRETEKNGNKIYRIFYPKIKLVGLLKTWFEIWKLRDIISEADIVHVHDVFIWYLPLRFLYPDKPIYTTFHGWEGKYPISFFNKFQKRLAYNLSKKTIAVGEYI